MIRIFEYELQMESYQVIPIMGLEKVLSVVNQRERLVMYVEVDDHIKIPLMVQILILGTGRPVEPLKDNEYKFLGTVLTKCDTLVWYVYYNIPPQISQKIEER